MMMKKRGRDEEMMIIHSELFSLCEEQKPKVHGVDWTSPLNTMTANTDRIIQMFQMQELWQSSKGILR